MPYYRVHIALQLSSSLAREQHGDLTRLECREFGAVSGSIITFPFASGLHRASEFAGACPGYDGKLHIISTSFPLFPRAVQFIAHTRREEAREVVASG